MLVTMKNKTLKENEKSKSKQPLPKMPNKNMPQDRAVPELPENRLSNMPGIWATNSVPAKLVKPSLSIRDEVKTLEETKIFADKTSVDINESRPCIANLFYNGITAGSIGRKPSAFVLALELSVLELSSSEIRSHLISFNERCFPPITTGEIESILRSISKETYNKRYSCLKMQAFCIGKDICPWLKMNGKASRSLCQKSGPNAFMMLGWCAFLPGATTKIYLTLLKMRIQRGLPPDKSFSFYFAQLEYASGVSRSKLRNYLERLKAIGLITDLVIGLGWNSKVRQRTKLKLVSPIPDPKTLDIKPLKIRNKGSP